MILCFVAGAILSAAGNEFINAKIVDYKINLNGPNAEEKLQNPLLSYNDCTYISARDVGRLIYRDVSWSETYQEITFKKLPQEHCLIQKEETALAIGKAIAQEYYSERMNENTKYMVHFMESGPTGIDYYLVCVMFEPPADRELNIVEMTNECDLLIEVGTAVGATSVVEKQADGSLKRVMGRMGRLEIE